MTPRRTPDPLDAAVPSRLPAPELDDKTRRANESAAQPTDYKRLVIELPVEQKQLLMHAAQLEGVRLSRFVLTLALERARKVVADAEQVTTTAQGYREIQAALASSRKPNRHLHEAMREYEEARIQWG